MWVLPVQVRVLLALLTVLLLVRMLLVHVLLLGQHARLLLVG